MSRRLNLPENTLLFSGSGKYSSISKVTVTLCPATLRTAQILGGSGVYAPPIGPQGPRHHHKWELGPGGTEQVRGREGVCGPTEGLLSQERAKRGSESPRSADEQGY